MCMDLLILSSAIVLGQGGEFLRHEIDRFPAGYQTAVADLSGDGRPDVIALSTDADRLDWYENPSWKRRPIAGTARNIDLAVRDLDRDGRPEIALAWGFFFSESDRGGEIGLLEMPRADGAPWTLRPIAVDPVVHRLRWGDLDGDGRPELVHAPIFGPGSKDARDPRPSRLRAFRPPADFRKDRWDAWPIDETLTVLHGLHLSDTDGDGRDEVLAASFEGICRLDHEGPAGGGAWRKASISPGAPPREAAPGSPRGASEAVPGKLPAGASFIASIEPWHGNAVAAYRPGKDGEPWRRTVLDEGLVEGHALLAADLDGDGADEVVAGWRGAGGGLVLFDPADEAGTKWSRKAIDPAIPVEGLVAADLNGDGLLDLAAAAGRAGLLVWYENRNSRK